MENYPKITPFTLSYLEHCGYGTKCLYCLLYQLQNESSQYLENKVHFKLLVSHCILVAENLHSDSRSL